MRKWFKKRYQWSKWIDIEIIPVGCNSYLLQCSECENTGKKRFRRARIGYVNNGAINSNIATKLRV